MNIVIAAFLLHYLADWILQSCEMGRQKSNKFKVLCQHISIIFAVICVGTIPIIGFWNAVGLSLLNALTHAVIDWYIWRGYKATVWMRRKEFLPKGEGILKSEDEMTWLKENFKYWEDPVFGHFLGADQLFHYIILYLIYGVL